MNNSKSELIIFGNRIQANKCDTSELNIEGGAVHKSQIVKYLGPWLDSKLILKMCGKEMSKCYA